MKEIKRYEVDDFVHTAKCLKEIEVKDGQYVKYSDHESIVEKMQKRIDELEAERKQIKSAIDPGYDDIRYSMMLLNEILNEDK